MPLARVTVNELGTDCCVGVNSAAAIMAIWTEFNLRTGPEKTHVFSPATGATPGDTGSPRAAVASSAVSSEHATGPLRALALALGAPAVPVAVAVAADCVVAVCVPPTGVPLGGTQT